MAIDHSTLRRYTQWLPILVLVAVCVAWWSPLGVVAALAACLALGGVLQHFDLVGDAVGGALLRSRTLQPFAGSPPAHDVLLDWGELGMGGPTFSTQMLRDGAIVEGISTQGNHDASGEWLDLAGTPLRLAAGWIDRVEAVIAYDERHKRVLHLSSCLPSQFWQELGERRQQESDVDAAAWVRGLPGTGTSLQPYRGLWLAEGDPVLAAPPPRQLRHVLPDGRMLQADLLLPDDLRLTAHPALFIHVHPRALQLDGIESGRHVCGLDTVIASPSGHCLVVAGSVLGEDLRPRDGVWLVHHRGRWQAIARYAWGGMGKDRRTAWVDVRAAGDDGTLQCEAYEESWDGEGLHRRPAPHASLALPVEWRETALPVRAHEGRFQVRLPA